MGGNPVVCSSSSLDHTVGWVAAVCSAGLNQLKPKLVRNMMTAVRNLGRVCEGCGWVRQGVGGLGRAWVD